MDANDSQDSPEQRGQRNLLILAAVFAALWLSSEGKFSRYLQERSLQAKITEQMIKKNDLHVVDLPIETSRNADAKETEYLTRSRNQSKIKNIETNITQLENERKKVAESVQAFSILGTDISSELSTINSVALISILFALIYVRKMSLKLSSLEINVRSSGDNRIFAYLAIVFVLFSAFFAFRMFIIGQTLTGQYARVKVGIQSALGSGVETMINLSSFLIIALISVFNIYILLRSLFGRNYQVKVYPVDRQRRRFIGSIVLAAGVGGVAAWFGSKRDKLPNYQPFDRIAPTSDPALQDQKILRAVNLLRFGRGRKKAVAFEIGILEELKGCRAAKWPREQLLRIREQLHHGVKYHSEIAAKNGRMPPLRLIDLAIVVEKRARYRDDREPNYPDLEDLVLYVIGEFQRASKKKNLNQERVGRALLQLERRHRFLERRPSVNSSNWAAKQEGRVWYFPAGQPNKEIYGEPTLMDFILAKAGNARPLGKNGRPVKWVHVKKEKLAIDFRLGILND